MLDCEHLRNVINLGMSVIPFSQRQNGLEH